MARNWSALSPAYQARLARAGIDRNAYNSGASLQAARGHKHTPEHPKQAVRNPKKYAGYIQRKSSGQKLNTRKTIERPFGPVTKERYMKDRKNARARAKRYAEKAEKTKAEWKSVHDDLDNDSYFWEMYRHYMVA